MKDNSKNPFVSDAPTQQPNYTSETYTALFKKLIELKTFESSKKEDLKSSNIISNTDAGSLARWTLFETYVFGLFNNRDSTYKELA